VKWSPDDRSLCCVDTQLEARTLALRPRPRSPAAESSCQYKVAVYTLDGRKLLDHKVGSAPHGCRCRAERVAGVRVCAGCQDLCMVTHRVRARLVCGARTCGDLKLGAQPVPGRCLIRWHRPHFRGGAWRRPRNDCARRTCAHCACTCAGGVGRGGSVRAQRPRGRRRGGACISMLPTARTSRRRAAQITYREVGADGSDLPVEGDEKNDEPEADADADDDKEDRDPEDKGGCRRSCSRPRAAVADAQQRRPRFASAWQKSRTRARVGAHGLRRVAWARLTPRRVHPPPAQRTWRRPARLAERAPAFSRARARLAASASGSKSCSSPQNARTAQHRAALRSSSPPRRTDGAHLFGADAVVDGAVSLPVAKADASKPNPKLGAPGRLGAGRRS
jgi:hypothetical protein